MLPALKRLDGVAENLAAAIRWSLAQGQPELALRLGGAARWWVFWRGGSSHCRQYLEWLESALALSRRAGLRYRVKALGTIGMCAWRLTHLDKWRAAWEDELVLARKTEDPELIARALCGAALSHWGVSQPKRARARLQEGLQLARDCCYPAAAKWALLHLAQFEPLEEQHTLSCSGAWANLGAPWRPRRGRSPAAVQRGGL
jgi:hypothetical protein